MDKCIIDVQANCGPFGQDNSTVSRKLNAKSMEVFFVASLEKQWHVQFFYGSHSAVDEGRC